MEIIERFGDWLQSFKTDDKIDALIAEKSARTVGGMEVVDQEKVNRWGRRNVNTVFAAQARCRKAER